MGRTRSIAAAVAALAVVSVGGIAPAQAGEPPATFNEIYQSIPVTVNGTFMPLHGALDCHGDGGELAIIWYAPGSAADWRWTNFELPEGDLEYSSAPLSVNGTYEPFVGDFDGDGCDDVFWYAPGPASDFVWYGAAEGGFASHPVTVNGDYTPLVGDWDDSTPGDDIFWYGSGGGTESIWRGSGTRGSFGVSTAPQVSGTDFVAVSSGFGALFYRPGPGADYIWEDILAGASAPGSSVLTNITKTYQSLSGGFGFLLYAPGTAPDKLVYDWDADGTLLTIPGTINGTYRLGVSSPEAAFILVFHAPGAAQDYLWFPELSMKAGAGFEGATAPRW